MLFLEVEGVLPREAVSEKDAAPEQADSRRIEKEDKAKIAAASRSYNSRLGDGLFFFVSEITKNKARLGIIAEDFGKAAKFLVPYLKRIRLELKDTQIKEITLRDLRCLLSTAERREYIDDSDEVLKSFDFDKIRGGRYDRGIEFDEDILEERSRSGLLAEAGKHLMRDALLAELSRIYAGASGTAAGGHPVHYMIQTDDREAENGAGKILLQALYANGRLASRRYCSLDFDPAENFSFAAFSALYKICSGGAVILRYKVGDDIEGGGDVSDADEEIEQLCKVVRLYRHKVLTIFCLPRKCEMPKRLFCEKLGTLSFVRFSEEFIAGERADEFLKSLAQENKIRADKQLFGKIEADKRYLAAELRGIFDEWYDRKLKTAVYPQYKDITNTEKEAAVPAPKDSAYDELQKMVGLTEAKKVIKKALDYFKMQKLWKKNGVGADTPALHMVFTGSPGTAKTTVARLFARIMKENGLLSRGQLVEVDRSGLVGTYVGWTAKIVRARFREARGGVLFIDEAYSLVDDRDGSFGDEAINTIVREMENLRGEVVVIFAGYPDKMEGFLQKNPGLRSRVAFHVPFADYSTDELCEIARLMANEKGLRFTDDACKKLSAFFEEAGKLSNFGNGRCVRNALESAEMNRASRILARGLDSVTAEDMAVIEAEDIDIPAAKAETRKCIGF